MPNFFSRIWSSGSSTPNGTDSDLRQGNAPADLTSQTPTLGHREYDNSATIEPLQRGNLKPIEASQGESSISASYQQRPQQRQEDDHINAAAQSANVRSIISGGEVVPIYEAAGPRRQSDRSAVIDTTLPLQSEHSDLRPSSPGSWLKKQYDSISRLQGELRTSINGPARFPRNSDFGPSPTVKILESAGEPVQYCILLLHDSAKDETQLMSLAKNIQKDFAESAFVLLRGLWAMQQTSSGYHWADPNYGSEDEFIHTSRAILEDVIKSCLVSKCNFQPHNIIILGYGQGGKAALATAASWNDIEFGGAISIGGSVPSYIKNASSSRAETPALILKESDRSTSPTVLQDVQSVFVYTDSKILSRVSSSVSHEILEPILEFLTHRLRQEEWIKQAVITFDGGGIRGYGSLLILKDLMNKIGDREKRLDNAESSFSPCEFKPTTKNLIKGDDVSGQSSASELGDIVPTSSSDLPYSSLFLPCHYFTYTAGTSTGGLISIMLSRLRMSVDECLEEYEALGDKIFGHPRPFPNKGLMWHKFDHKRLEEAIREVTSKYDGQQNDFESFFAMDRMDEDLTQCIVLAYADSISCDIPYLFRTFPTTTAQLDRTKSSARQNIKRNYGDAQILPIWKVARATSAAPGYFRPIRMKKGNSPEFVTFKDGGFGNNNPCEEAYEDIIYKHGGHIRNMGPFISIGTGYKPLKKFVGKGGGFKNLRNSWTNLMAAVHMPSRTLRAHEHVKRQSYLNNKEQFPYYRFDGGEHLGKISLGEWKTHHLTHLTGKSKEAGSKTLEQIKDYTTTYLSMPDVQKDLSECADILVRRRRLRVRNASSWDRFASFSYYECDLGPCSNVRFKTLREIKDHVGTKHTSAPDHELDRMVKRFRKVQWIYGQRKTATRRRDEGKRKA